jgi:hypothetical protein
MARRRKQPATNQPVVAADVQFELELEVFRTEVRLKPPRNSSMPTGDSRISRR